MTTATWPDVVHNCTERDVDPRWFDYDATPIQRYHAQQTCIGCPASEACLQTAIDQHLRGYFAGLLVERNGTITRVEVNPYAADARAATDAQLADAHREHSNGARDDLTIALNREYDRRRYQTKRLEKTRKVDA